MNPLIISALLIILSSPATADTGLGAYRGGHSRPYERAALTHPGPQSVPSMTGWNIDVADVIEAGTPWQVLVVDDVAYVGYSESLAIFDISEAAAPVRVGAVLLAGSGSIEKAGDYLYCLGYDSVLEIVDISALNAPRVVTSIPGSWGFDLDVDGGYLYADNAGQLQAYDLSDPINPVLMGSCPCPNIWELIARDGLVYVGSHGLRVIDATSPANPVQTAFVPFGGGLYPLELVGNTVFIVSDSGPGGIGLYTFDVSIPSSPTLLHHILDAFDDIAVENDHAYLLDHFDDVVHVFNVEDPANPVQLPNFVACGLKEMSYVDIDGNTGAIVSYGESFFTDPEGSICFFDVTNPAFPNSLCKLDPLPLPHSVEIDGNQLVVSGEAGRLALVNRYDGDLRHVSLGNAGRVDASRVVVMGDYAYVSMCDSWFGGTGRLQAFDISDPSHPTMVGYLLSPCGGAISQANGYIYYSAGKIWIVDVSNPAFPSKVGELNLGVSDMFAVGETLFACSSSALRLLDVSNPTAPVTIATLTLPSAAYRLHVADSRAYVITASSLEIVDVSNPSLPTIVGSYPISSPSGVRTRGSYAYLSDGAFLRILDVSNPASPAEVGNIETGWLRGPVAVSPPYIYAVTAGEGPLLVLETPLITSVPQTMGADARLRQNYPNPFNPATTIGFQLETKSAARIEVFDVRGRFVCELLNRSMPAGAHSIDWDGRDRSGKLVGSGIYFYRLTANGHSEAKKMMLLK